MITKLIPLTRTATIPRTSPSASTVPRPIPTAAHGESAYLRDGDAVGADTEEARHPQRDQARVAAEKVEGHRGDRVDEHVEDQCGREAAALERGDEDDAHDHRGRRPAEPPGPPQRRQRELSPAAGWGPGGGRGYWRCDVGRGYRAAEAADSAAPAAAAGAGAAAPSPSSPVTCSACRAGPGASPAGRR